MRIINLMKFIIICLILFCIAVISLEWIYYECIPSNLLMPIVASSAIIVTLTLALISYVQWQKNRLELEVLKEQFNLVIEFLNYMKNNPNWFANLTKNDEKILLSSPAVFSISNYLELDNVKKEKKFSQLFTSHSHQWFNELDNSIVYHPLFPKKLFAILYKLDTNAYMINNLSETSKVFLNGEHNIPVEEQLLVTKNMKKEKLQLANSPILCPYKNDYLSVADVLKVYIEFNVELEKWFKENNITSLELNINNRTIFCEK